MFFNPRTTGLLSVGEMTHKWLFYKPKIPSPAVPGLSNVLIRELCWAAKNKAKRSEPNCKWEFAQYISFFGTNGVRKGWWFPDQGKKTGVSIISKKHIRIRNLFNWYILLKGLFISPFKRLRCFSSCSNYNTAWTCSASVSFFPTVWIIQYDSNSILSDVPKTNHCKVTLIFIMSNFIHHSCFNTPSA